MSNYFQAKNYTIEELEHALKIAARVVVLYGEVYLPVFNRLHNETLKLREVKQEENLALNLAMQYAELE